MKAKEINVNIYFSVTIITFALLIAIVTFIAQSNLQPQTSTKVKIYNHRIGPLEDADGIAGVSVEDIQKFFVNGDNVISVSYELDNLEIVASPKLLEEIQRWAEFRRRHFFEVEIKKNHIELAFDVDPNEKIVGLTSQVKKMDNRFNGVVNWFPDSSLLELLGDNTDAVILTEAIQIQLLKTGIETSITPRQLPPFINERYEPGR